MLAPNYVTGEYRLELGDIREQRYASQSFRPSRKKVVYIGPESHYVYHAPYRSNNTHPALSQAAEVTGALELDRRQRIGLI